MTPGISPAKNGLWDSSRGHNMPAPASIHIRNVRLRFYIYFPVLHYSSSFICDRGKAIKDISIFFSSSGLWFMCPIHLLFLNLSNPFLYFKLSSESYTDSSYTLSYVTCSRGVPPGYSNLSPTFRIITRSCFGVFERYIWTYCDTTCDIILDRNNGIMEEPGILTLGEYLQHQEQWEDLGLQIVVSRPAQQTQTRFPSTNPNFTFLYSLSPSRRSAPSSP